MTNRLFRPYEIVIISGYQARPEVNGMKAFILFGYAMEAEDPLYNIFFYCDNTVMTDSDKSFDIPPSHLQSTGGFHPSLQKFPYREGFLEVVKIVNCTDNPELNGKMGLLLGCIETDRYVEYCISIEDPPDDTGSTYMINQNYLQSTHEFCPRSDYYAGDSIRVAVSNAGEDRIVSYNQQDVKA